ncbi:FCD domain-containing protein [Mesorhizobium amorphae]|uniref:FCD domain-containing protein n=1 Tax=Mesorhizobium amorphae TaxID=71433 RepID=UPI003F500535
MEDIKSYLRLNQRFHFTIYQECGNAGLVDLIELLWMRYGPLMNIVRSGVLSRTGQVRHAEAIDAIREGNRRRRPLRSRPIIGKPLGRAGTLFQPARPNWKRQELRCAPRVPVFALPQPCSWRAPLSAGQRALGSIQAKHP